MKFATKIFNSHPKKDENFFVGMKTILGFKPKNLEIYKKAFLGNKFAVQNHLDSDRFWQ